MDCSLSGISRGAKQIEKQSLTKHLKSKSQVQPTSIPRNEAAPVQVGHNQDTTIYHPTPLSTSIPPDKSCFIHVRCFNFHFLLVLSCSDLDILPLIFI